MWVKICANTNLEDTQMALDLGADAVGFVFASSPRRITSEQAATITAHLRQASPGAERIGVFQTTSLDAICDAVQVAGLTGVQLHHTPNPELIAALRAEFGSTLTIAQTLHWPVDADPKATAGILQSQIDALCHPLRIDRILLDAKVGEALGGTGTAFDWTHARPLFRDMRGIEMIVAGGLNPENVREAVQRLGPWGVDVASGVEQSPGKKDPERLRLFLERARAATLDQ